MTKAATLAHARAALADPRSDAQRAVDGAVIGLAGALAMMGVDLTPDQAERVNRVTGMLFARVHGTAKDGRELVSLTGIVAAPPGTFKPEHQHVVVGDSCDGGLNCYVDRSKPIDVSKHSIGNSPSGLLLAPIWRY